MAVWVRPTFTAAMRSRAAARFDERRVLELRTRPPEILLPGATCRVTTSCKALSVSRPGFYAWRRRPESTHAQDDRRLAVLVRESHDRSRKTYGSPRVHADLGAQGVHVSRKRVARLMQEQDLRARVRRRYK